MRIGPMTLAALALALGGTWAGAGQPPDPALVDRTRQASDLERDLKNARNPDERAQIADSLERTLHQMGPFDASGTRIHPKAMWHDTVIEALAAEVKRLESRTPTSPQLALAQEARLQTLRMASACLLGGWQRLAEDGLKYQVDAFGQYLANNLKTLDAQFDALGLWCGKASRLEADSAARPAYEANLGRARDGIAKMRQAADEIGSAGDGAAVVAALGLFVEGLRAVREADLALAQAEAEAPPVPSPDAAKTTPPVPVPSEPPPITDAEKQRIAEVREAAASLDGPEWQEVRQRLERYVGAVTNGFAVASARPKARDFLDQIECAAALAQSLHEGKGVFPGYLEDRLENLKAALAQMESPLTRADGYATLRWAWEADENRRTIAGGPITPKAAEGIAYAHYVVQENLQRQADIAIVEQGRTLLRDTQKIVSLLEQLPHWPTPNTKRELRELYNRQLPEFKQRLEDAGNRFAAKDLSVSAMQSAANAGRDLERLVRAQHVYDLVAQYQPARAAPMYGQLATAAAEMVLQRSDKARENLNRLVRPFERLESFKMPETRHQRAVTQVAGSAYASARAFLNREIAEGIQAASEGDSRPLSDALAGDCMFALLWRRAVVLTNRLDRFGVTNLAPLSASESVWTPFVAKLDQTLRTTLAAYPKLRQQGNEQLLYAMAPWDDLYQCMAGAQRLTADERREGESDADFLLRNLERTAVADPRSSTWTPWAVAYHATEGASALMAGFSGTADWHRSLVQEHRWRLTSVELDPTDHSQP